MEEVAISKLCLHHILPIDSYRYYYLQYLKLVYNKYKAAYLRWLKFDSDFVFVGRF